MTIGIKTGSWFAKLPPDHIKIGISRSAPRGLPAGYRLLKRLSPGPWFSTATPVQYDRLYRDEILRPLNPHDVANQLLEMAAGKVPVMCCFESKPGEQWCHRSMTARWLSDAIGQPVPEFGFESLSQQDHPFMPTELRAI